VPGREPGADSVATNKDGIEVSAPRSSFEGKDVCLSQCWGSGSRRISMFLGLPDPDPLDRGTDPEPLDRGTDPDPPLSFSS
jgi:hypothetical protein